MYEIDLDKLPHKNAVELLERVGKREKMKKKLEAKVRGIKMEKERMKELVEMDIKKKEMEKDKAV